MIRFAELDDIGRILPMAIEFNDKYFGVPLNLEKAVHAITWIIEDGIGLVSPGGFIGGVFTTDLIRDTMILQELAWYSTDRSGLKLLGAFIEHGKQCYVEEIRLSTLETSSPVVGKLLQRMGFAPLETSYRLRTGATPPWPQSQP